MTENKKISSILIKIGQNKLFDLFGFIIVALTIYFQHAVFLPSQLNHILDRIMYSSIFQMGLFLMLALIFSWFAARNLAQGKYIGVILDVLSLGISTTVNYLLSNLEATAISFGEIIFSIIALFLWILNDKIDLDIFHNKIITISLLVFCGLLYSVIIVYFVPVENFFSFLFIISILAGMYARVLMALKSSTQWWLWITYYSLLIIMLIYAHNDFSYLLLYLVLLLNSFVGLFSWKIHKKKQ